MPRIVALLALSLLATGAEAQPSNVTSARAIPTGPVVNVVVYPKYTYTQLPCPISRSFIGRILLQGAPSVRYVWTSSHGDRVPGVYKGVTLNYRWVSTPSDNKNGVVRGWVRLATPPPGPRFDTARIFVRCSPGTS